MEVQDVEPRRRDTGEKDVADVLAVESVEQLTDGGRRVAPADGTGPKREAVDHPVRADDGAGEVTQSVPIRRGDAQGPSPRFHVFVVSSSLMSFKRSSS